MVRRYYCGKVVAKKTSTTLRNPSNIFYEYGNFSNKDYRYFDWLDEEFNKRGKDLLSMGTKWKIPKKRGRFELRKVSHMM